MIAGVLFAVIQSVVVDPGSQVSVHDYMTYRQNNQYFECVSFVNNGPKAIASVVFRFSYFDVAAKPVASYPFTRTGPFPAGADDVGPKIEDVTATMDLHSKRQCQTFKIPPNSVSLTVQVDRVDFTDGTSWYLAGSTPAPAATTTP